MFVIEFEDILRKLEIGTRRSDAKDYMCTTVTALFYDAGTEGSR